MIHLCFAILLLNIFFLLGIERKEHETFCFASTILLHYAVLLAWAWMFAEATFLFRAFVLSNRGVGGSRHIWVACFLCYGKYC